SSIPKASPPNKGTRCLPISSCLPASRRKAARRPERRMTVANPARELKQLMSRIADGETLGDDGMQSALDLLMSGIAPPVVMGAFLMALRLRGETTDEIAGAAKFLRSRMTTV